MRRVTCELCWISLPPGVRTVPHTWELVFGCFICPDCVGKAREDDTPLPDCRGGVYALDGAIDPRLPNWREQLDTQIQGRAQS